MNTDGVTHRSKVSIPIQNLAGGPVPPFLFKQRATEPGLVQRVEKHRTICLKTP